jgi:uncharacterized protein YjiK
MLISFMVVGYLALEFTLVNQLNYENHQYELVIDDKKYDLRAPKERWDLPEELNEISGLSFYRNGQLACIQDENGALYIYSLNKNEIIRKEVFGDDGDYEGVEMVDEDAYVLQSNGKVYHFTLERSGISDVNKIKTHLSKKNDAEGLGLLHSHNDLLIACKGDPDSEKYEVKKGRSVFRIDLEDHDFKKKPRFHIEGKKYNEMLEKKGLSKKKHKPFKPSGIAVHPTNGYVFLIGSVGKMMVILKPDGQIENLIPLDRKVLSQPEGICFAPNGDLYISSEGRGKKGYILKF